MIAYLSGVLKSKAAEGVVVDVQGVGYEVFVTKRHLESLPDTGAAVEFLIHTHVSETAFVLYGFAESQEKELFRRLISVSGIGPKMGLQILAGLTPDQLIQAIVGENLAALTAISGVGKKTAERMVVELKDKVLQLSGPMALPFKKNGHDRPNSISGEVISGLVNLGYPRVIAERAVLSLGVEAGAGLEDIMKRALTVLARG
jgi:Holliday junction DNA helicase RuvA